MNTHVRVPGRMSSHLVISLGAELLGHMATLCSTCQGTLDAFNRKSILNYQHVNVFLHGLLTIQLDLTLVSLLFIYPTIIWYLLRK